VRLVAGVIGILTISVADSRLQAGAVPIPNGSFELPSTPFVSTIIDSWEKPPKPDWYVETGEFLWDQLTGIFLNPAPGAANHIDNCDGQQALWLFAVPEVSLFQDLEGPSVPPQSNWVYEVDKAYLLEAGIIGGGGGMLAGVPLELAMYFRDESGNMVTVAATSVTNDPAIFSSTTHFVDFTVRVPAVKATDPWAGRALGVRFLSTVGFELQGGYWDLDNIRLTSIGQPILTSVHVTDGEFQLELEGEPGTRFDLLASADPGRPLEDWTQVATLTNETGRVGYSEPAANAGSRVYRARQSD
jgi:hypothetical protein